jgi:predicted metalloprotease with PDZ domain
LCSHEYFHSWNVKRIKPEVYRPYNLQHEVYTDLLWAFEGITSYYDDLALVRTGLIDTQSYLELLAQTMTRVQRGLGRKRQSAAESSYNAWTKFYKQDENAANSIVSYYAKGCLIAACIDLKMREISAGAKSLDDVMRSLWREYLEQGRGVEPERIQQLVSEISGEDLGEFLKTAIYGTGDLPLVELLDSVGVDVIQRPAANLQDKGGKDANGGLPRVDFGAMLKAENGNLVIQRVIEAGSAQSSGLAAGDQIVAVDGLRLDLAQFEKKVLRADPGDFWYLHAFRRDELRLFEVEFQAAEANTIVLKTGGSHQSARGAWLNAE